MPFSKDAMYMSVSGFQMKFTASFSIIKGVLSAPGDFDFASLVFNGIVGRLANNILC